MDNKKINYTVIIALVLVVSILTSCKKYSDEYTTVEFVIVNPVNGKPFEGVHVKLLEEKATNKGIVSELFKEGVTNANGRITFKFKAAETSKYWYAPIIDDSYFGPEGDWEYLARPSPSSYTIKKNQYNEMRYEITYFAYLKQIIKNVNCEGAADTLNYHCWYKELSFRPKSYDDYVNATGCFEYETGNTAGNPPGYRTVYMGTHIYKYTVIRPSGVSYGTDSIYLDKGEFGTLKALY